MISYIYIRFADSLNLYVSIYIVCTVMYIYIYNVFFGNIIFQYLDNYIDI